MTPFQDLLVAVRSRFTSWLTASLPTIGVVGGLGVSAWCIGATLGQLVVQAQSAGWLPVIALLSAELGKEFVVGLVERIRDEELSDEDIARIIQAELDKRIELPDLRKLLDEVGTLPATLDHAAQLNNAQLLAALQADLAAYPMLISAQTARALQAVLGPRLDALSQDVAQLDAKSERVLAILMSLAATPHLAPASGVEPPLLVFVSSLIGELSAERQMLRQTITGLGITRPWIFEFTPATAQPLEKSYLNNVRTCDLFVLLIDENSSPAVEKEFDTALQHHRPILAFLKKDKDDSDHVRNSQTHALISRIPTKWATFADATDLALKARAAITDEVIRGFRNGLIALPEGQAARLEQAGSALRRVLNNLPARRYTRLVGRKPDIELVLDRLRNPESAEPCVIAISGLGGIGKTALAYEVVERALLEDRFDGLVWESAKPEELEGPKIIQLASPPSLSFESLIVSIARQLGFDALVQLKPDELYDRLRALLQAGSYLIVVDNLETVVAYEVLARQLHALLSPSQSSRPSRALLTSRERLIDIPYLYDHYIRGLSKPSSIEFMYQEATDRGALGLLQAGQELLDRIFEVTGGMPLAMKLIVSQFLVGIPLDTELERLKEVKEEKELYKYIYMRLWFKLSIPAQKVLISAAAFASSVARFMLQPVSKTSDDEFEVAIPQLVRMSLVEPTDHITAAQRRYSIHSITRWFINSPLRDIWEQQKANSQTP